MATVEISRSHSVPLEEAKMRLRKLVEDFHESRPELVQKVRWAEDRCSATATGRGFKARFDVDATMATVEVDLSLVLRPFKKKIAGRLEQKLEEALGPGHG